MGSIVVGARAGLRSRLVDSERALAILDAAYAQGVDDARWLRGLLEAIQPAFDRGLGVCAYFVKLGGPGEFEAHGHIANTPLDLDRVVSTVLHEAGPEFMRQAHLLGPYAVTTEAPYARVENASVALRAIGGFDAGAAAGLIAINADGAGVAFGTYAPTSATHDASDRAFWERIVPHLITAYRLRRSIQREAPTPDAILRPDGRVVHATGAAQPTGSLDELRRAVIRIDQAHARSDEALDLWRCMIQRRWTLVDQFESDGRRYIVAFPNEARALPDPRLSPRERVAASLAALGHSNKMIGESLGLAESTVATHLARAARKLGVRTRAELVQTYRTR